ncbi:MAG: efflux RND transporter periplasmic adaptor subunit, partial [Thermacetogeniaceae bacterium]
MMLQTLKTAFAKTWSLIKGFPGKLVKNRKVLIVTVLVVLVAGFFGWRYLASTKKSSGYTTTKAAYGDVQVTISASGNIVAVQSVALTFKSSGYVQACYVKLGDTVKAGQALALEQTSDLQSSLDQAEANLESAQASYDKLVATKPQQIAQAQANADNAKATLDSDQQLLAVGAISQSDLNTADYQYKTAALTLAQTQSNADVIAAAAQVKNAQAQVTSAQNNLDNAQITAPFDGYISTITGNPGMWTGGGASSSSTSTATQFEIIMTSKDLQIDAEINEADISKVSVGQSVTFTVDTYPNQSFTGKIIALSPNASTVS